MAEEDDGDISFESTITVRFFRLRNALKDKVGGLGGGDLKINTAALEKAQSAFENLSEDYPDWVMGNIKILHEHHQKLVAATAGVARERLYAPIRELAHDMRGQGGTFGYPLISDFAESLCGFVGINAGTSDNHIEIIKAHIDAMQAVIKGRIKGKGGDVGEQLAAGLKNVIEKYSRV